MGGAVRRRWLPARSLLRSLWKRKLLAGFLWLAGTAAAVMVVQLLPATYRAETLLLVESQRIPDESVQADREAEMLGLLNTRRQQVLSQQHLLEIIDKFDLYHGERQTHPKGEVIERMRSDISIALERGWSRDRPGAFRLAYQGRDPDIVAKVANQLAILYVTENSQAGETQPGGTLGFPDVQVEEARKRLQAQEAKLSEYKLKYSGQLPPQENALLADLSRLQVQLQGVQDAINRTRQDKTLTDTMLASAQQSEEALSEIVDGLAANPDDTLREATARESARLQKQLETLRLRYTDEHPEVRKTRDLLAKLREWEQKSPTASREQGTGREGEGPAAQADASPALAARTSTLEQALLQERERVKNLEAQRDLAARQLQALEAEGKRVEGQIASVQGRIAGLPIRERELMALNRDYDLSKAAYQSLLDRNLASQTEIGQRLKPEKFTILEPAVVPARPLKPNRGLLDAMGTVVALLLGVGLSLGSEVRRGVVLGEWEIPKDVVILGRVPAIRNRAPGKREKGSRRWLLRRLMLGSAALLLAAAVLGAAIYFRWIPI